VSTPSSTAFFETADAIAYDERTVEKIAERGIVVRPTVGQSPSMPDQLLANLLARQSFLTLFPR
jgi:hypothetical protein